MNTHSRPVRPFIALALISLGAPAAAQGSWRSLSPSTSPTARYLHRTAFDPLRDRTVLFGGKTALAGFGDTWEWDGSSWMFMQPTTSPSARWGQSMVFDEARGRVLLYGGSTLSGLSSETWGWDGTAWTQLFPAQNPGPRYLQGATFDASRQRVVLFGGLTSVKPVITSNETWEWDGTNWAQRATATQPAARYPTALSYDTRRNKTVLFGGSSDHVEIFDDTWEYDGNDWQLQNPSVSPPARRNHDLFYHEVRDRTVLLGGLSASGFLADTWE